MAILRGVAAERRKETTIMPCALCVPAGCVLLLAGVQFGGLPLVPSSASHCLGLYPLGARRSASTGASRSLFSSFAATRGACRVHVCTPRCCCCLMHWARCCLGRDDEEVAVFRAATTRGQQNTARAGCARHGRRLSCCLMLC